MSREDVLAKAERSLHNQYNLLPKKELIFVFGIISICTFINFVDQNGISTTLPTIAADLNAEDTISWAGTSSLLANATFQMLYGRLSDIFGRKNVFLTAIGLLAFGDLLCGLSRNAAMFYVFRGVAGIGGGGITNLAMTIVSDVVTLEDRGKYQGIIGSMVGLGSVVGPFLAATLVEHTSWRAYFWLLAPLGTLTGVLTYFFLPSAPRNSSFKESVRKVDWLGSFLISAGLILLLIPISGGGSYFEWKSPMVISMLVVGCLCLILFVIVEWKVAELPMMPIDIYKNPVVVIILVQNFFMGVVYQSYLYYIPLYLQNAHQYPLIKSALIWIPLVGTQALMSVLSGLYVTKFKRYGEVLWVGFGLWTLGAGLTLILDRNTSIGQVILPLVLIGLGVGLVFQPTLVAIQAHSPKSRRAVIISNRNLYRCAGGACGLAISGALLQARLRTSLPRDYAYLANSTYALPKGGVPDSVLDAYMAASHGVFILQIPLITICLLCMVFIRDRGLEPPEDRIERETQESQPEGQAEAGQSPVAAVMMLREVEQSGKRSTQETSKGKT